MSKLKEDTTRLFAYQSPCWHVHETILCNDIELKSVKGIHPHDRLSNLINAIRNGYVGNKKSGVGLESTGRVVADLSLTNNGTSVSFSKHGEKEFFRTTNRLSLSNTTMLVQPRYFSFGKPTIDIKTQLSLVRVVQGCLGILSKRVNKKTRKRRQDTWYGFYNQEPRHTRSFCNNDLSVIIEDFPIIFPRACTVISSCEIIREAIYYSNQGGTRRSTQAAQDEVLTDEAIEHVVDTQFAVVSPSPNKRSRIRYSGSIKIIPTGLTKGALLMCEMDELANIQHCLYLRKAGSVVSIESLNVSAIDLSIVDYEAMTPKSIDLDDINGLNARLISCAWNNVMATITERLSWLRRDDVFMIKDGDLLIAWMSDGRRYSSGERFFNQLLSNFVKNSANGKLWLSDKAAHVIRHIVFTYKIALSKISGLWNCFAILLIGRSLSISEFVSSTTLSARFFRLQLIDRWFFNREFASWITTPDKKYGFVKSWYIMSDDSIHHDKNRHVLLMTAHKSKENPENESDLACPCYRFVTASESPSKDSTGNSQLNVDSLVIYINNMEVLARFGGSVTDNASDAMLEGSKTFSSIIQKLPVELRMVYGVKRLVLKLGDWFHIDNLIVTHASLAAFGDTIRGEHRQIHHRQLVQSLHDIHKGHRSASQRLMNKVLEGTNSQHIHVHTERERQQRWMVVQRMCKWIIDNMSIVTADNESAMIAWAHAMVEYHDGYQKQASQDVLVMLLMPDIVAALMFEADLGNYFEVTMKWHASPGELSTRPGFRVMEMHQLYFDFIVPFWEESRTNPRKKTFKRTFEYIEANIFDEAKKARKIEQVFAGIAAAHKELLKMSKLLMSAPLIFCVMTDEERGVHFVRALMRVLFNTTDLILPRNLFDSGIFDDTSQIQRSEEEDAFYNLMINEADNVEHWWRQFGYDRQVLKSSLCKELNTLSTSKPNEREHGLLVFQKAYPILFAGLHAMYGLMPSVTRMCEQSHGLMRDSLEPGVSLKYTDARQAYITDSVYYTRESRRKINRQKKSKKGGRVKHDNTKQLQQMEGHQLVKSLEVYEESMIDALPETVKESIIVRNIRNAGSLELDKHIDEQKEAVLASKRARRTAVPKTMEYFRAKANETSVDNDKSWVVVEPKEKQRIEDMETYARIGFWNTLRKEKDGFFNVLEKALPLFWQPEMISESMGTIRAKIKLYLGTVHQIAEKLVPNKLSEHDVTHLSRLGILAIFVDSEAPTFERDKRSKEVTLHTLTTSLFVANGSNFSQRTRYRLPSESIIYEDDDDDSWSLSNTTSDDDGEDDHYNNLLCFSESDDDSVLDD